MSLSCIPNASDYEIFEFYIFEIRMLDQYHYWKPEYFESENGNGLILPILSV